MTERAISRVRLRVRSVDADVAPAIARCCAQVERLDAEAR